MRKQICDKHSIPLEGCIVQYFGRECPLCKALDDIKALQKEAEWIPLRLRTAEIDN